MRRPVSFLAPFALLLPLLAACKSNPDQGDGVTQKKVVLTPERTKPRGKPKQPPKWFEAEIEAADREKEAGRIREALERVYAAKEQNPGREHRRQLDAILRELNQAVLELETIRAWIEVAEEPVVFGEELHLRIHMHNGTKRPVRIPAAVEGTSNSVFVLNVVRRNYDARANVTTWRMRVIRPLQAAFEIPPGGSANQAVILESKIVDNDAPLDGVRTYTVGGMLRPVVLELGGLRRWEAIPIRAATLRSFRENYEHLADDPVRRVREAIRKRSGVHLITACALVPPAGRQSAVDAMVEAVRGDRAIDWAMFAGLQYLTGVELGRDATAWKAWWPRVRETYFDTGDKREPADVPVFRNPTEEQK